MRRRWAGRRDALRTLLAVPAGLTAAALTACESTVARLRGWRLTPIATTKDVPRGSAYRTTHGDQPLVLVNVAGDIRTFLGVCTHERCPLARSPQQHLIRCPCHGSPFGTQGGQVHGPS